MPKTGLKTFVYSFSASLFAIFAANGIYWHNRPSAPSEIKIPSKNIVLFLKNGPANPSNLSAPVKKIALSILPEVKQKQDADRFDRDVDKYGDEEIIMADNFEMPEIPLEIELPRFDTPTEAVPETPKQQRRAPILTAEEKPSEPRHAPVLVAENAAPKPRPARQEEIRKPEKIVIPLQVPEAAGIDQPKAEALPHTPAENTATAQRESPAPKSKPRQQDAPPALLMAQADEPIPLLPLEKSGDTAALRTNKVRIGSPHELEQVALADKTVPIRSMEENKNNSQKEKAPPAPPAWESMAEKSPDAGSPWLVAKADGALKNNRVAAESYYQKEEAEIQKALNPGGQSSPGVKVAAETVKNLLIPIPEDILNDENLTPQLSYSPNGKEDAAEKAAGENKTPENSNSQISGSQTALTENRPSAAPETKNAASAADDQDSQRSKLLSSLNSIFSANTNVKKEPKTAEKKSILSEERKKFQKADRVGKIMPTEMRLSFQPNRAEISGQTLRWIQAFAAKAAEDNNMAIEIRIDGTSAMDLQQKRLNLLHNILTNKGVEYSKINTVFTQREPNSFIIKTITRNNSNQKGVNGNLNKAANGYYQQW